LTPSPHLAIAAAALALLAGCAGTALRTNDPTSAPTSAPISPTTLGADPAAACAALTATIPASAIGLPSGAARIDSATLQAASPLAVAARGPTPAARITPALPAYCRVLGRIAPLDTKAPDIVFQVNLPLQWNGRSLQYGGGGFNGTLINALGLPPAQRFDTPAPLAQGFITVGTDSGHQNKPGEPPQVFALNDEALLNFAHASYKKVRDVSVALARRAYGRAPDKLYFMGSSEGGREGLTMAQRYPADFDGILARVPVIHWTGLQHAGLRDGLATRGEGWLNPAHTRLVHDAVLAACDAADGLADGVVADPVGCRQRFDISRLRCTGPAGDACLSEPQIRAVQTLHAPLRLSVDLANGLRDYPGRGPSGEGLPAAGPTGGWGAWWLGSAAPALPPAPANGIAWFYGAGAIQYFYARDSAYDLTRYRAEDHAARVREVSALMDSTNPDLSAFHASGGKLVMLENMADYAQSPYAGIQYFESVVARMGAPAVRQFARLYTAPGVDHVGSGAPANVDLLGVLVDWAEQGRAPAALQLVEQSFSAGMPVQRARPLCEWPTWPRYQGGDAAAASSFACVR
jgi:feruloyl esterase